MKAVAIAAVNIRRMLRDRSNIFFVFVFPMLLILVLGVSFGRGFEPRIGLVAADPGPLGQDLVRELEAIPDVDVERYGSVEDLRTSVERGQLEAGVLVPEGYDAAIRAGRDAEVRYVARQSELGLQLSQTIRSAVAEQGQRLRAARLFVSEGAGSLEEGLARAGIAAQALTPVEVVTTTVGEERFPTTLGRFDLGASSMLLLFIFLTSMTSAVALIETRRLGLSRRMLSTPTSVGTIVVGEGLGRFGIALVQGLFIMLGSLILFGVDWGDPLGSVSLLLCFALVGAGAGMLLGSLLRTEQQAIGVGILLGLGLGALGGCMVPMEFFSSTMVRVAHFTPHAWAIDGYAELIRRGGSFVDALPYLGILLAYAAVLFGLASWRLRRAITG
ncbi:MAG TPA: ABC transporter permease [Actinomycetota bacterium]|nr:ABC transporter permease [Actinomycetota bacterium]